MNLNTIRQNYFYQGNPSTRSYLVILMTLLLSLTACQQKETKEDANRRLLVAENYIQQGQLRAANLEARNALQINPNSAAAHYTLGKTNSEAGDQVNAESHFLQAVKNAPQESKYLYALAATQVKRNKPDLASATLKQLPSTEHRSALYHQILGDIFYLKQDFSSAEKSFQSSLSKNPQQATAMLGLARVAFAKKSYETSLDWLNQAVEADTNNIEALLFKGEFEFAQGNYQLAENSFADALSKLSRLDMLTAQKYRALEGMVRTLTANGRTSEAMQYSKIMTSSPQGKLRSTLNDALNAYQSGDFSAAETNFESILSQAPSHGVSSIAMGAIKFSKGDFESAEEYLSAALEGSENVTKQTYTLLAITQLRLNKGQEARELVNNGLKHFPDDPDLTTLLGLTYAQEGDMAAARRLFKLAVAVDTTNLSGRLSLATLYFQNKEWMEAKKYFVEAAAIAPNNFSALTGWLKTLNETQTIGAGIADLKEFSKQHPDAYGPLTLIGIAHLSQKDILNAIKYGEAAEKLNSEHVYIKKLLAAAYYQQAKNYSSRQDLDKALSAIQKSRQYQDSHAPGLALEANLLNILKGPEAALSVAKAYAEQYPTSPQGFAVQGDLQVKRDNFPQAMAAYEQAWSLLKNRVLGLKLLHVKEKLGISVPEAHILEWYESLASETSPGGKQKLEESTLTLALAYQTLQKPEKATKLYEKLVSVSPNNAIYINNLAWLYYTSGKQDAIRLAEKAYKLNPNVPQIADTYGWILVENGQLKKGINVLELALNKWPNNTDLKNHLDTAKKR